MIYANTISPHALRKHMLTSASTVPVSSCEPQRDEASHRHSWALTLLGRSLPEFITPLAVVYHQKVLSSN
jgi:hypothetical protein